MEIMNSLNALVIFTIIGMMVVGTSFSTIAFAEPKNGWGKATSERATEQHDIGDHSRAGGAAGEPPFDSDGDKPGRQGIGNVGDSEDNNFHPNDLGNFLDCVDEDVDEGEGGSVEACS